MAWERCCRSATVAQFEKETMYRPPMETASAYQALMWSAESGNKAVAKLMLQRCMDFGFLNWSLCETIIEFCDDPELLSSMLSYKEEEGKKRQVRRYMEIPGGFLTQTLECDWACLIASAIRFERPNCLRLLFATQGESIADMEDWMIELCVKANFGHGAVVFLENCPTWQEPLLSSAMCEGAHKCVMAVLGCNEGSIIDVEPDLVDYGWKSPRLLRVLLRYSSVDPTFRAATLVELNQRFAMSCRGENCEVLNVVLSVRPRDIHLGKHLAVLEGDGICSPGVDWLKDVVGGIKARLFALLRPLVVHHLTKPHGRRYVQAKERFEAVVMDGSRKRARVGDAED